MSKCVYCKKQALKDSYVCYIHDIFYPDYISDYFCDDCNMFVECDTHLENSPNCSVRHI